MSEIEVFNNSSNSFSIKYKLTYIYKKQYLVALYRKQNLIEEQQKPEILSAQYVQ